MSAQNDDDSNNISEHNRYDHSTLFLELVCIHAAFFFTPS